MKDQKTNVEKIVEKGNKRLNKFYNAKIKQAPKQKQAQYLQDAKIDNCLKLF